MTSLDDLLSQEQEDGRRPSRPAGEVARWLLRTGLLAAAVAAALVLVLRVLGYGLSFPVAMATSFALLGLRALVAGLGPPPPAEVAPLPPAEPPPLRPDHLAAAVRTWQIRLSWGRAGIRPFTRTSPWLAELVDERLRQRHGFTRASDPARARTLLSDKLWSYLADPDARTPSPRDLAGFLIEMERL
ncbi:MAG TPA: hypothetical protein VKZ74_01400 [Natronosporangium sp.]|nr:hypothetical protein [Natronosporangium sp.]